MKSKAQIELEEIVQEEWQAFYRGELTIVEMNAFDRWVEYQEEELDRNWELEYEE